MAPSDLRQLKKNVNSNKSPNRKSKACVWILTALVLAVVGILVLGGYNHRYECEMLANHGENIDGIITSCESRPVFMESEYLGTTVREHLAITIEYEEPFHGKKQIRENWDNRWNGVVHVGDKIPLLYLPANRFLRVASVNHPGLRGLGYKERRFLNE